MAGAGYFSDCIGYTLAYGVGASAQGPGAAQGNNGNTYAAWVLPGGTGSIWPSEYGVHSYDQYSGSTLSVYHKDFSIGDVELSDTFEAWRLKTNDEIIEKLNLLHVYGATAADGTMIALGTGGTLAVAFSGNVMRTHSTFCNHVSIGKTLKVDGSEVAVASIAGGVTTGFNVGESLLILNTNESPQVGCDYSGFIIGGSVTGPNPVSIDNSDGGDYFNSFAFDRPYFLHREGKWRTKEALWLEGRLNHQEVFTGRTASGSTGEDYPYGPYGYTGCSADKNNPVDWGSETGGVSGGVVRIYFGPTLANHNYLEIDGRGGRDGVTGDPWRGVGGATGALVLGNIAGPLLEFDTDGYVNIHKGANKKRIVKKSHGFSFGNVLRYSGTTQGYTFASAAGDNELHGDGIRAAEVVGVVSKVVDAHTFDLCFVGEIEASKSTWNDALISGENSTEGLVPGTIYYLSQYNKSNRGRIQREEPMVAGYVNRPVLLATGKTSGVILPYRGQYNSGTGCTSGDAAGASGSELTSFVRAYDSSSQTFVEGNAVVVDPTKPSGVALADNRDIDTSHVIGVVTYVDTDNNYLRIATSGTVTLSTGVLDETGSYYLHENGNLRTTQGNNLSIKVLDAISPTRVVLNIDTPTLVGGRLRSGGGSRTRSSRIGTELNVLGPTGATGATWDNALQVNKNHLLNPDFGIWQRGVGTTGAYTGTAGTYFADRWLRISQTGTANTNPETGKSGGTTRSYDYKLARASFDKKETKIEGHPNYYAIVRGGITFSGGTLSNEWYRVEQRIEDCTSFAGEVMTVSFYCKGNNPGNYHSTGDCHVAFIQNLTGTTGSVPGATSGGIFASSSGLGVTANEIITPISDFAVTTNWEPYNYSFLVPELSNAAGASGANHSISLGVTGDHFVSLAFYTQNTNRGITFMHDLHLSQVKLERGNIPTKFEQIYPNEELRKCWRYYQTSYEYGVPPGSNTMSTTQHPDTSGVNFVVPNAFLHIYEFPERMRTIPTCAVWSPTGLPNDGFNRDASKDTRYVAGTKGYDGRNRIARANTTNISCTTDTPHAIEIKVLGGAVPLDTITIHYEADAEFNNAFPTGVR